MSERCPARRFVRSRSSTSGGQVTQWKDCPPNQATNHCALSRPALIPRAGVGEGQVLVLDVW